MDPVSVMVAATGTVLEAVLGDSAPKVASAIVGGLLGNRADALLCRVTRSSWNFFTNLRTENPALNHDLERATREAYLLATLELIRQAEVRAAAGGYASRLMSAGENDALASVRRGIEADLRSVADLLPKPITDAHLFLIDPDLAPAARLVRLQDRLRANLAEDFARWLPGRQPPAIVEDLLTSGWTIDTPVHHHVRRDWYGLIGIAFVEKLKTTPRLATVFESKMLAEIAAREPAAAPIATFSGFAAQLDQITAPLQRIEDALGLMTRDVAEIKEDVRAIRDALGPLGRIPRPVWLASGLLIALAAASVATETGARAACRVPGVRAVCAEAGIGGVPSAQEEALWRARPANACEPLRAYLAQFPDGAYAAHAGRLLAARTEVPSERWQDDRRSHVFTVRSSVEPLASETEARADAIARAGSDARSVCSPYEQGEYRLRSARAVPDAWRCAPRGSGVSCAFDGVVVCEVQVRRVDVVERCQ